MKKLPQIVSLLLFFVIISANADAQCKNFAKRVCKLELHPFIHDGNYNAAILTEGEEAELYKTFYSGQQYRIAICGSDALPPIQFQIMDLSRNVLYDNSKKEYARTWDFELESSQQLIIWVKVSNREGTDDVDLISGCVSIMFGIKD
jgi:hypothetical protein